MATVKTSWDDLARLGWSKENVFKLLNGVRQGTMDGPDNMTLNEGQDGDFGGSLVPKVPIMSGIPQIPDTIVAEFHNTSDEPVSETVTVKWTIPVHVTLSIKVPAAIELKQHIVVYNICKSDVALQINTEDTDTKEYNGTKECSRKIDVDIAPGETVKIVQHRDLITAAQSFYQDYGLADGADWIVTHGKTWNGQKDWPFSANTFLNDPFPSGTMELSGTLKTEKYTHTIERIPPGDENATRGPAPFGKAKVEAPAHGSVTEGKAPVAIPKQGKNDRA
ncbi:hypothetical protein C8Q76DRAFT_800226 [Earliella scabrosa]|nr:hypothetical protein C8Q76DRAFT_800225 [Earliella scabrosa]KAI0707929.1 hypothetical protein C8Q76DRAFT_800226 [Earliella scabrosa]